MAIAFNAVSTGADVNATTVNYNHTTAGSDRYLIVMVISSSNALPAGVSYNGVGMTQLGIVGTNRHSIWGLADPALGTNTVSVNYGFSGGKSSVAISYTGVDSVQPDAYGTSVGNGAGGNPTLAPSVTTIADNTWTLGFTHSDSATVTAGASTTLRQAFNGNSGYTMAVLDTNTAKTPAGSTTVNINYGASNLFPTAVAMSIAPKVSLPPNKKTLVSTRQAPMRASNY